MKSYPCVQILAAMSKFVDLLELQFLISKIGIVTFILNMVIYTIYFCIVPGTLWVLLISSGWGFSGVSEVKAPACSAGDLSLILGLGRSPGKGNGNPLQYSCLENPMDRGAWWAILHKVAKSWTRLSDFT